MSQSRRSPISKLALNYFHHSFGDLLSIRALITEFDHSLLEGIFERILWFGRTKHDYDNFERTARAAHNFLEKGNQVKHKAVAQQFALVIDKIIPALNDSGKAGNEAAQVPEVDADSRIKKYLEFYKVMYEGLLPLICAPVVYSFGIAKHIKDKAFIPDDDGKIGLNALKKMEKWLVYPENRLAIGLNNHIRNAYVHERYRILDDARVELWDHDPYRPNRSWGPEIWPLDQLTKLCDQLWVNTLGITCALVLYCINNRQIVAERGWVSPVKLPQLRREELKAVVNDMANELGFYLNDMELLPGKLSMNLSTKSEGINQQADLMLRYKDHVQLYKIPMWYEKKRVVDQLTIMLHRIMPYVEAQSEVSIQVFSPDEKPLGELVTDFPTLTSLHVTNFEPKTVENIRHAFKSDTLGDCVTFVEKEGVPKLVGTKPVPPNSL